MTSPRSGYAGHSLKPTKGRTIMHRLQALITGLALVAATSLPAPAQDVPAPGKSARIDAIKKAGVLRVAVLANAPWLVENTTGSGEKWSGPAWLLASEYAQRLG